MRAKELKDEIIRKEIRIISSLESDHKGLKRNESEILKRLKETHIRQQNAINEILAVCASQTDQTKPEMVKPEAFKSDEMTFKPKIHNQSVSSQ